MAPRSVEPRTWNRPTSPAPRLSRRGFLRTGQTTLVAGVALTGCDLFSTDPAEEGQRQAGGGEHANESPMLADQVGRGELPPLEERLPDTPLTVEPLKTEGVYGGSMRMNIVGTQGIGGILDRTIGYDHLVRWALEMDTWTADDVIPDVAADVTVNDDATEYVFHLRPGMKWSDGEPFGADDFVFWYEDVLLNADITPDIPRWLQAGGDPVVVEKEDDQTVVFRFSQPNGLLLGNLAHAIGYPPTRHPRHYLEQFHVDYNPGVEQDAEDAGLTRWADLFLQKSSPWENAELPVLTAWMLTESIGEATQRVNAVRNPYYWKVDPAGRQLPYIDEVTYELVSDLEVVKLKAFGGEVDLIHSTLMADLRDKPLFARNQEDGGYELLDLVYEDSNTMAFSLNVAHSNPAKRAILGDRNFRIGLSHAIDRNEVIDTVFQRQGEPHQIAPHPGTAFYNEQLAQQFTEYSVEEANRFLDEVLPDKDGEGRRLGPNGRPFSFSVDVAADTRPRDVETLELMQGYFAAVGVDMEIRSESETLFWERLDGNLHDSAVFGSGGGLDPIYQPDFFLPIFGSTSMYAVPWSAWYMAGGLQGDVGGGDSLAEEPSPGARAQMELYDQLMRTPDTEEQKRLMDEILAMAQEEFWCIGISLPAGNYGIVSNRLHNVQNPMIDDWPWQTPGPSNVPQYFIQE